MSWMSEYEVYDAQRVIDPHATPNLAHAVWVLGNLVDWTNRNSDGWPYWSKPSTAATRLQKAINNAVRDHRYGHAPKDLTKAELRSMLTPVKSFLTRQGGDHAEVLGE